MANQLPHDFRIEPNGTRDAGPELHWTEGDRRYSLVLGGHVFKQPEDDDEDGGIWFALSGPLQIEADPTDRPAGERMRTARMNWEAGEREGDLQPQSPADPDNEHAKAVAKRHAEQYGDDRRKGIDEQAIEDLADRVRSLEQSTVPVIQAALYVLAREISPGNPIPRGKEMQADVASACRRAGDSLAETVARTPLPNDLSPFYDQPVSDGITAEDIEKAIAFAIANAFHDFGNRMHARPDRISGNAHGVAEKLKKK